MLAKFRQRYPQGSLVSELVKIDRGTYIVKTLVQVENTVLATALAGADTVEAAEDAARERAIAILFLDSHPASNQSTQTFATLSPQPESSSESSGKPKIDSEAKVNESKIVNFSQPQLEISELSLSIVEDAISAPPAPQSPEPQSNLPKMSESAPVTSTENNLFGDTFTAEISPAVSAPDDSYNSNSAIAELEAMDFNEIKQKTDIEIRRLGWSKDQGKEFLMSHYGKRSRLHLTDEQLLEFLRYLEKLPNPVK